MDNWDDWIALHKFISEYFSDDDLEQLCFEKFPDFYRDYTEGITKTAKVRSLIKYCYYNNYYYYLHQVIAEKRPNRYAEAFTVVRNNDDNENIFAGISAEAAQDDPNWENPFADFASDAALTEQPGADQTYLAADVWSDVNYAADTNTGSTVEQWGTSVRKLFNELQERLDNFSMQDPGSLNMALGALATMAAFVIVAILFSIFYNPPSNNEVATPIPVLVAGASQQLPLDYREPALVLTQGTPPRRLSITLQDCIYAGCSLLFASDTAVRTAHLFPLDCVIVEPFVVVVTNGSISNYQVNVSLLTEEFDRSTCIIQQTPPP